MFPTSATETAAAGGAAAFPPSTAVLAVAEVVVVAAATALLDVAAVEVVGVVIELVVSESAEVEADAVVATRWLRLVLGAVLLGVVLILRSGREQ